MDQSGQGGRDQLARTVDELVDANHILFRRGVVDAFGHVSARHPGRPDRFLLARSMAPALVRAADILEFYLDGGPIAADAPRPYLERFIHGEIYRLRADVSAVVHSHAEALIPFGAAAETRLRPIWHMCGFLGEGAPVFEIRDHAGEASDLLIRDRALGAALARALGAAGIVLMRGHGATLVGSSLRQAVYRAVYAEAGARIQAETHRLGTPIFLTPAEALAAARANDGQIDRAWDLWLAQTRPKGDGEPT